MSDQSLTHEQKVEKLLSAIGYSLAAISACQLTQADYNPEQILKHDALMQAVIQMIADCNE